MVVGRIDQWPPIADEMDRAPEELLQEDQLVPPDRAPCSACLRELFDPADRRFGYPFVSCAECGPAYSISESLPFERANTTMLPFEPCPDCSREYDDPADRRFLHEAIACPGCGPRLVLRSASWSRLPGDPIRETATLLLAGKVLALKGPGGYQLACDATDELAAAWRRLDRALDDMVAHARLVA